MKKLISILLAVVLAFALVPAAFAADAQEIAAADVLYTLGLFKGTGTDAEGRPIYDLDRAPNRAEAVTMLVRLLGKEEEAQAGSWTIPFTDVADWAKPYVGYAYANGLTNGTSDTTFSGTNPVTATQYLTFVLRALGYSSEAGGDFRWDAAWELTNDLGITCGEYDNAASFDRGDVVKISYSALGAFLKGEGRALGEKLLDEGVFTLEQYRAAMSGEGYGDDGQNPVMNFVGDYQCDRANAHVECDGTDSAIITIRWSDSAWQHAEWIIVGPMDTAALTITYTDCLKTIVTYNDDGEIESEDVVYDDGTGTIVFNEDGNSFIWYEDQSEYGRDMRFVRISGEEEEPEDWQNPVMNFIGTYVYGRANALVDCDGRDNAIIEISWSSSYAEHTEWTIIGRLDTETLTIRYADCTKTNITVDENGEIVREEVVYTNGTGTVVFGNDGTFTWHEDQSEYNEDYVFEYAPIIPPVDPVQPVQPVQPGEDGQNPVMDWAGDYRCETVERARAHVACTGTDSAIITIRWSGSVSEYAEWVIMGELDLDTLTIRYTDCSKSYITVDSSGNIVDEEVVYDDGTGTIVFDTGLSFIWHEDQSDYPGTDMLFQWNDEG